MDSPASELADELATLRAEVAVARARMADDAATIARQNLEIAKLKRQLYGPRSERSAHLIAQMELELEELEAAATEDELAAELAAAKTTTVAPFARRRPSRQPFPAHLPRERMVVPAPTVCACCGGNRLRKLGESVTETLEVNRLLRMSSVSSLGWRTLAQIGYPARGEGQRDCAVVCCFYYHLFTNREPALLRSADKTVFKEQLSA